MNMLTVFVESTSDACVNHDVMQNIDNFIWQIQSHDAVLSAQSLTKVAKQINAGWHEGHLKWGTLL
jgi:predicted RND superfamily exporter protein